MTGDRDVRALRYIQSRIGFIERDPRQDPLALSEEGRTAGQSILWALMTLADSTTKLSDSLKTRHPEIDWVAIRGFRNVAAHVYDRLQLREVNAIVTGSLPALKAAVDAELAALRRDA